MKFLNQIVNLALKTSLLACLSLTAAHAQRSYIGDSIPAQGEVPTISYAHPISKVIAGIEVKGNKSYEAPIVISVSGLTIGQRIEIPGDEITAAVHAYNRNGLFQEVSIEAARVLGDKVWLTINIVERPRLSEAKMLGVKKGEAETLFKNQLASLQQGTHLTPNIIDRAKIVIQRYFGEKGFTNVQVDATEQPDPEREGYVYLTFHVIKNTKTTVQHINFIGNKYVSDYQLRRAMKKTNERFSLKRHPWNSLLEIFSAKRFVQKDYKEDLNNLLALYHEKGYRDAEIISDSVYNHNDRRYNIDIKIDEGQRYYIKQINFVGNTKYNTDDLSRVLGMKKGDVYDQKKLEKRLNQEEDAVSNLYANNGYLFSYMMPVETEVLGDSVSLDIRIHEGKPATINKVVINGNTQLYEDVVRRELYTKPGMLFSKDHVIRSIRQIMNMGHFDQEKITPNPIPHEENGTVDIEWDLVAKSNDQVELSLGWSQTGIIGRASLKFTNFSVKNLFNPKSYKGIIPQGEGQTLTLSAQTNARYYQSYSIQFMDPWFGGKRPNMFNVSAWWSRQTQINQRFYNSQMASMPYYNPYMMGYEGGFSPYAYGGGYSPYGYGGYGGYGNYGYGADTGLYESAFDPDKTLDIFGGNISYGKRLVWPDDSFQVQLGLNYTVYRMKNWTMNYYNLGMENGISQDLNLSFTLARISTDNPIYTRRGSNFTFNISATPPYSLFDKIDYSDPKLPIEKRNKLIEYYKIKLKGQTYIPLLDERVHQRTPVLMARAETSFIGAYTPYKPSPFGTFYMGGDGMAGYYGSGYLNETVGLRGYKNGTIASNAYAYSRISMELRYPLLLEGTTIWVLGFIEAGNAWQRIKDYNPFHLKRSAGVGFRAILPMIGLMGIDWGYGFDIPDGRTERGGSNIHFVMGQEF